MDKQYAYAQSGRYRPGPDFRNNWPRNLSTTGDGGVLSALTGPSSYAIQKCHPDQPNHALEAVIRPRYDEGGKWGSSRSTDPLAPSTASTGSPHKTQQHVPPPHTKRAQVK